jgi:hypothetical protein
MKFRGFNDKSTLQFAQSFDGRLDRVGNLEIEVTEETLSNAMGLPRMGNTGSRIFFLDKRFVTGF